MRRYHFWSFRSIPVSSKITIDLLDITKNIVESGIKYNPL